MKEGWTFKSVKDVAQVIAGQSPEGRYYNTEGVGLPFYQGKKEFGEKYIKPSGVWTSVITKTAIAGDILMSVRAPVGPVNVSVGEICIGRGLAAIRQKDNVLHDFLFYFFKYYEGNIKGNTGAVFDSINKAQIENIPFLIPPLPEQKRIVSIIDKAFEAIDKAIENTQKNLQNAKELFESYLNSVFENDTEGWECKKLKDITHKIGSGSTPRGGQENYQTTGIALIRSMNVYDLQFKPEKLAFINDEQAKSLSNVTLKEDDVLLNITGASIARCCVVPNKYLPARVNQHVSIIRPKSSFVNSKFLNLLLTSKSYKNQLLFTGEQGSTRQALTKVQLEAFEIRFPNLNEQLKITTEIDNINEQTDLLETKYQQKLLDLEELKKSILNKAFAGEL